jgi:hypothetical protein
MSMRMTPVCIQALMHWHYCDEPLPVTPAFTDAIKVLRTSGLIDRLPDDKHTTTARGKAYVEMICNTPFPEMAWIDPRNKKD